MGTFSYSSASKTPGPGTTYYRSWFHKQLIPACKSTIFLSILFGWHFSHSKTCLTKKARCYFAFWYNLLVSLLNSNTQFIDQKLYMNNTFSSTIQRKTQNSCDSDRWLQSTIRKNFIYGLYLFYERINKLVTVFGAHKTSNVNPGWTEKGIVITFRAWHSWQ